MLMHMRTSVEIPDALLKRVRKLMARRHTTLRALIEEGLRRVLHDEERQEAFELRDARFRGKAMFAPGASEADVARAIGEFNEGRPER
jgi:predicted transcriptional regulator